MKCRRKIIFIVVAVFVFYFLYSVNLVKWNKEFNSPVLFQKLRSSSNGKYNVWDNVYKVSSSRHQLLDIGAATQTTLNNFHQLIDLAKKWKGPLSVAIFISGQELELFKEVLHLSIQCHGDLWESVSFHAVIPLSHPPEEDVLNIIKPPSKIQSCHTLPSMLNRKNYEKEIPYPVNTLRNVAVDNLNTSHVVVLDVDMTPRENFRERILKEKSLLSDHLQALVIPVFEIKEEVTIPVNKEGLLDGWNKGIIRPFYFKVCEKCQRQTNYDRWKTLSNRARGYHVSWKDHWEPFYVAQKSHVHYDERFEQYGFNRISQLCHLHMMGFSFFVLFDEFLLHKGFKEPSLFHSNKEKENKSNKKLYEKMKEEILERYPQSSRRC